MKEWVKYLLLGVIIIIAQLIIEEYVNYHPLIHIAIFPLFIIILPTRINQIPLMLISLVIGLLIDILSDGIIGLNSAALIAMAFVKLPILNIIVNKNNIAENSIISSKTLHLNSFSLYCLIMYTIFFLVYVALDGIGYISILYSVLRFIIYIILNTIISILIDIGLSKQIN